MRGLSQVIGFQHDSACEDPSRIFYVGAHPKTAKEDDYYTAMFRAPPIQWDDIPAVEKPGMLGTGQGSPIPRDVKVEVGGGVIDVTGLYYKYAKRWNLSDILPEDMLLREADGGWVITCAFQDKHTDTEKTGGTIVYDAETSNTGFAKIDCKHSCQSKHTVVHLAELLKQGAISPDNLEDPAYMVPLADGQDEKFCRPTPEEQAEYNGAEGSSYLERAQSFDKDTKDAPVIELFSAMLLAGAGESDKAAVEDAVVEAIGLKRRGRGNVGELWKRAEAACAKIEADKRAAEKEAMEMPDLMPLDTATVETVNDAAANIKWPGDIAYRNGWFGKIEGVGADQKFLKVTRAFEPVYCADGGSEKSRTSEITIRYPHRAERLGIVESTYSLGETYRDSGTILGRIADDGLEIHPYASAADVLTLLRSVQGREAVLVDKAGWTVDKQAWISPTGEFVTNESVQYVLQSKMRVSAEKAGTLELWRDSADTALRGRNRKHFLPGFLIGGAGMIVDFLDEQMSLIITNEGEANRGKSTSLYAGVSWLAITTAAGLVGPADATDTATEGLAVRSNGGVLVLDEEGTTKRDGGEQQALVLRMAGGMGRARGKADGGLRDVVTWRTAFGTSTEAGFVQRMEQSADPSDKVRTGAVSRVIAVNYDNAVVLDKVKDADELAAYAVLAGVKDKEVPQRAYGWAGTVLAQKLLDLGVDGVNVHVKNLHEKWGKGRDGAQDRVVRAMAILGATANIAKEAGLIATDIPTDKLLGELLDETLRQRAHHLNTATQSMDRLRRGIIEAVTKSEIIDADGGERLKGRLTLGYYKYASKAAQYRGDEALAARMYILPIDRLSKLGVNTDIAVVVERLKDEGGWVEPGKSSRYLKEGLHDYVPTEGKNMRALRVTGAWVHGLASEKDPDPE
ncbi:DUF927 domain-containing protein [Shimia thalassica]|uniref:DUF927 domain-containing protein n=1 Tax=Shimia thalassica TaxID=1715693 RepID=UPI0026E31CFE|nr:DUF927 domain-containing protein [Shimia thalassica]MDO6800438.1 DUF927 domain-containing protein [Shimia thalassica]